MTNSVYLNSIFNSSLTVTRNIDKFNFTTKLNNDNKKKVEELILDIINKNADTINLYDLTDGNPVLRSILYEAGLINREIFAAKEGKLAVLDKFNVALGINIFDHITMYSSAEDFELAFISKEIYRFEELIGRSINYAAHSKYGYLSPSIKSTGLGLTAEVKVFLPGLSALEDADMKFADLKKKGYELIKVIPFEGVKSSFYSIKSSLNYGISEESLLSRFEQGVRSIIDMDRDILKKKFNNETLSITDTIYRSYGILRYARTLTYDEALTHLDNLRVGLIVGVDPLGRIELNRLQKEINLGHLSKLITGKSLTEEVARAEAVRAVIDPDSTLPES